MNPTVTVAAVAGLVALGALAGHSSADSARVVSSVEHVRTVSVPREECRDAPVVHPAPVADEHRLLGTGIGAALGGILGHQIGRGRGNTAATIAGAAAGGYAGNQLQGEAQRRDTVTAMEHRCTTVYERHAEPAGYDVVYDYRGQRHTVHLDQDPGTTLRIVDGKPQVRGASRG